jgi:hypothetical protein
MTLSVTLVPSIDAVQKEYLDHGIVVTHRRGCKAGYDARPA